MSQDILNKAKDELRDIDTRTQKYKDMADRIFKEPIEEKELSATELVVEKLRKEEKIKKNKYLMIGATSIVVIGASIFAYIKLKK